MLSGIARSRSRTADPSSVPVRTHRRGHVPGTSRTRPIGHSDQDRTRAIWHRSLHRLVDMPGTSRDTYVLGVAIKIGTSGWSYPSWRPGFYPADLQPAEFLRFYAERFDTVELNATGYRLPSEDQFRRWAGRRPRRLPVRGQAPADPARPRDDVPRARRGAGRPARPGARRRRRAARRRARSRSSPARPRRRSELAWDFRHESWAGVEGLRARQRSGRRAVPLPAAARAAVLRRRPAARSPRRSATRPTSTSATRTSRPPRRPPTVCATSYSPRRVGRA